MMTTSSLSTSTTKRRQNATLLASFCMASCGYFAILRGDAGHIWRWLGAIGSFMTEEVAADSPLRQLSLIDPKTVELRRASPCRAEDFAPLAERLRTDPEASGLRPLALPSPGGMVRFEGLDAGLVRRAFLENRIALVGDSTLTNLFLFLGDLLAAASEVPPTAPLMENMTLSEGNRRVVSSRFAQGEPRTLDDYAALAHTYSRPPKFEPTALPLGGGREVLFQRIHIGLGGCYYRQGCDCVRGCPREAKLRARVAAFAPRAVVANAGMHLLHMVNYKRDVDGAVVRAWIDYEIFLADAVAMAEDAGAELLLLKTTNFICAEQYLNDELPGRTAAEAEGFRVGHALYSAGDERALGECFSHLRERSRPETVEDDDIRRYCRDAVINNDGATKLNERLHRFVEREERALHERGAALRVAVFNDHDMQSCNTCVDGRHHHVATLARIRLLANYLDCFFGSGAVSDQ